MSGHAEGEVVTRDNGPRYGKLLEKPLRPEELQVEVDYALGQPPP